MLCGTRLPGTPAPVDAGRTVASQFTLDRAGTPVHLGVVAGPGGAATLTALVFDQDGGLLAAGPETDVEVRAAARTVLELPLPAAAVEAGELWLAVHTDTAIDLAVVSTGDDELLVQVDATPPEALDVGETPAAGRLQAFLLVDAEPAPPGDLATQARRGIQTAAAALGGVPDAQSARAASCGWYGTQFDPDRGLLAFVRDGGPLTDLVGARVLISGQTIAASVAVLVTAAEDIVEDIAVSRVAFLQLAGAFTEELAVIVEVIP